VGFRVRDAAESDLRRVAEIKVRNWEDTYAALVDLAILRPFLDHQAQLVELREKLRRPSTLLLVAEDAVGTVVGFALTYLDDGPDPWLESLHVIGASRGSGAGKALMRATAARLRERGYNALRLGVVEGNDAAARFYARLGGTMTGREPASWASGVWHVIYRWGDISQLA
jgi:ribosomal protein S18 acetylase RimI-like enzyme